MWRSVIWTLGFLVLVPALQAQEKSKDPPKKGKPSAEAAKQFGAIMSELNKERGEIVRKYRAAKGEEQDKLLKAYYALPGKYAGRLVEFAEKHAKDPVALQALSYVVGNVRSADEPTAADKSAAKVAVKAADLLAKNHIESKDLGRVVAQLERASSEAAEKFLRAALEKSPHKDVKGTACYILAKVIVERAGADQKRQAEAEKLYERAAKDFPDVRVGRGTIGKLVENDLFMLRTLSIGKVAPEIEAEDVDGVKFKLSDYRGKVLVLDFWGDW